MCQSIFEEIEDLKRLVLVLKLKEHIMALQAAGADSTGKIAEGGGPPAQVSSGEPASISVPDQSTKPRFTSADLSASLKELGKTRDTLTSAQEELANATKDHQAQKARTAGVVANSVKPTPATHTL